MSILLTILIILVIILIVLKVKNERYLIVLAQVNRGPSAAQDDNQAGKKMGGYADEYQAVDHTEETSNTGLNADHIEEDTLFNAQLEEPYLKNMSMGIYGDVPVYLYKDADDYYAPVWRNTKVRAAFVRNSKAQVDQWIR